ncbi:hypothetical protein Nepgr_021556 [Nepenthes gracilis]|uniref:histidine kinase n=1 Tax=Nepenthes gracilis TaxID=150966 RepID=A0AAD3SXP8_NEPGR|nr:hypothetical protein Nepgr_021556 [Nepenthes gracilis]
MNGVLGMLQMLMDTDLDPNQLDYVKTAHASGKDLIYPINEVLDQAKIESSRLELEAVSFDLRVVLDKVLSFSGKSHEKGIELAVYVSRQVPEIAIGDPGRRLLWRVTLSALWPNYSPGQGISNCVLWVVETYVKSSVEVSMEHFSAALSVQVQDGVYRASLLQMLRFKTSLKYDASEGGMLLAVFKLGRWNGLLLDGTKISKTMRHLSWWSKRLGTTSKRTKQIVI